MNAELRDFDDISESRSSMVLCKPESFMLDGGRLRVVLVGRCFTVPSEGRYVPGDPILAVERLDGVDALGGERWMPVNMARGSFESIVILGMFLTYRAALRSTPRVVHEGDQ